jgi:bifunctional non-homologous end joining protein LigD
VSLRQYQAKRHFTETPEPKGIVGAGTGALRFVVQKHKARRLHYDFRLEAGGVLKSWAVPKGPSLDPSQKRLAVMVEDHPLEYGGFEGTIPQGNYGAGTVMLWDNGAYGVVGAESRKETERAVREGLAKGHLSIVLYGQKLRGEFALVKTSRGENQWLLIKKGDAFASSDPIADDDRSVKSDRKMDEIVDPPLSRPRRQGQINLADAPERPMPHNVNPMLATAVAQPFDDPNWLFEIKWDGYRAIAEVERDKISLYSRNQLSFEKRYATIVDSLKQLEHEAVLDGEVVVIDEHGRPRFELLQNYKPGDPLVYYVFDLLWVDGHDVRDLPLVRRKELLSAILPDVPNIKLSDHIIEHGRSFYQLVVERQLEGIMAKDSRSRYLAGRRSDSWHKIKTHLLQDAVIGGFTQPKGSRQGFGALILGVCEGSELVYIGHTGTGFSEQTLGDVRERLEALRQSQCPFKTRPKTNAPAHWLRPELVCEVSFSDWTSDGYMRHPVFLGLRDDKQASEVRRGAVAGQFSVVGSNRPSIFDFRPSAEVRRSKIEVPAIDSCLAKLANGPLAVKGKVVQLTNLSKVYWPAEGYTKRDLVEYYAQVAPFILPYLKDRPLSLLRHPNGIEGKSFFQKDVSKQPPPDWVFTVRIRSDSEDKESLTIVCQDQPTLLYLANLGCIEINPWNARFESLDRADYLLLDLDPEDISFDEVVAAAQETRRVLNEIDAAGYCKTSGKRGLHIYVPLDARCTHDHAKQFGQLLAHIIHSRLPHITSVVRDPKKRQKRVYLDFLQNGKGKTLAAAYSVRPVAGARISTPLAWKEVKRGLDPSKFTIKTMTSRLEKAGDLWAGVLGPGIDLQVCLEKVNRLLRTS